MTKIKTKDHVFPHAVKELNRVMTTKEIAILLGCAQKAIDLVLEEEQTPKLLELAARYRLNLLVGKEWTFYNRKGETEKITLKSVESWL